MHPFGAEVLPTPPPPPWASHSAAYCCTNWANSAGKMTAAKIGFTAMAGADNSVIIQTVVEWLSFTLAWVNYQTVKALLRDSIIMWTALVIVALTETHFEFSLLSTVIPVRSHLQLQTLFHLSLSTYKFSRLISIHCPKQLVERIKDQTIFLYVIISWILLTFSLNWLCWRPCYEKIDLGQFWDFSSLNPHIKIQIPICYPYGFSVDVVGRICWSVN